MRVLGPKGKGDMLPNNQGLRSLSFILRDPKRKPQKGLSAALSIGHPGVIAWDDLYKNARIKHSRPSTREARVSVDVKGYARYT